MAALIDLQQISYETGIDWKTASQGWRQLAVYDMAKSGWELWYSAVPSHVSELQEL